MARLIKFGTLAGLTSVYLMQAACTYGGHGFSVIPNAPNIFAPITNLLKGFTT